MTRPPGRESGCGPSATRRRTGALWQLLDRLADVFWRASRRGVKLPIRGVADAVRAAQAVGLGGMTLVRYLRWTVADALRAHGLEDDRALVGLLAMLVEDTVHSSVAEAPLINAALGITIRGAGLTRARGGMRGFWRGSSPATATSAESCASAARLSGRGARGCLSASRRVAASSRPRQVVAAVPATLAARIWARSRSRRRCAPYLRRDAAATGRGRGRLPRRPRGRGHRSRRSPTTSSCMTTAGRWATATTCSSPSPLPATPTAPRRDTAP